jgi:hypothetical protein
MREDIDQNKIMDMLDELNGEENEEEGKGLEEGALKNGEGRKDNNESPDQKKRK